VSDDNDHAAVKFPPPLVGVLTILIGFGLGWFFPIMDDFLVPAPARYWVGGIICIVSALVFVVWPFKLFQKIEQDPKPWTSTPEIIVTGPYKFTRNPMYLMMVLWCVGFSIILDEAWVFVLAPVCGIVIYLTAIRHEEIYLEEKFGDSYRQYKANVRRWI
jgi:protein-S-isoprenylcysteine O-methyltransferase Ste14